MESTSASAALRVPCGARPGLRQRADGSAKNRGILIEGCVEQGDRRGRELGFPTANIVLGDQAVRDGVWAGLVQLADGDTYAAAVSVGRRASFYGRDGIRLLEAHLLDYCGDLYGQRLSVVLDRRLRPQRRFSDVGALVKQMHEDIADARHWSQSWSRLRASDTVDERHAEALPGRSSCR